MKRLLLILCNYGNFYKYRNAYQKEPLKISRFLYHSVELAGFEPASKQATYVLSTCLVCY